MKLQNKKLLYGFTIIFIIFSCIGINRSFQENSVDKIIIKDSLEVVIDEGSKIGKISKHTSKLIAVYDSTLCTSCQTSNLFIWDEFASLANDSFELNIIFVPNRFDYKLVKKGLEKMKYSFPVYIDSAGAIYKDNPLYDWSNINNHFFLLDKEQNVLMVGFPLLNDDMNEKYRGKIKRLRGDM